MTILAKFERKNLMKKNSRKYSTHSKENHKNGTSLKSNVYRPHEEAAVEASVFFVPDFRAKSVFAVFARIGRLAISTNGHRIGERPPVIWGRPRGHWGGWIWGGRPGVALHWWRGHDDVIVPEWWRHRGHLLVLIWGANEHVLRLLHHVLVLRSFGWHLAHSRPHPRLDDFYRGQAGGTTEKAGNQTCKNRTEISRKKLQLSTNFWGARRMLPIKSRHKIDLTFDPLPLDWCKELCAFWDVELFWN